MTKLKMVKILEAEQYVGEIDWFSGPVSVLIGRLQKLVDGVPEAYRDSVEYEIRASSGYEGSCDQTFNVIYWRPTTEEELAADQKAHERYLTEQFKRMEAQTERLRKMLQEQLLKSQGDS